MTVYRYEVMTTNFGPIVYRLGRQVFILESGGATPFLTTERVKPLID